MVIVTTIAYRGSGYEPEPYITTEEAAAYLAKPPSWLYQNARRLGIPRTPLGRQWRYRRTELDAWMRQAMEA